MPPRDDPKPRIVWLVAHGVAGWTHVARRIAYQLPKTSFDWDVVSPIASDEATRAALNAAAVSRNASHWIVSVEIAEALFDWRST